MPKTINVTINGVTVSGKAGVNIVELIQNRPELGARDALGAVVNNRLMGLYRPLRSDSVVQTVDYRSKEGANIYRRTLSLMMCEAFAGLYPGVELEIGQSLGHGYYYHAKAASPLTPDMIAAVEARMHQIAEEDRSLHPQLVAVEEAIDYFLERGFHSKVALLKQRQTPEIPWIIMGAYRDISYGPIAPRTGLCRKFALLPKNTGFVLNFPDPDGTVSTTLPPQDKLFETYRETRSWNQMLSISNVAQLNSACIDNSVVEIIKVAEALQEKKIARVADMIHHERDRVRLILIAGPSSSGKTTFTKRLAVQLRVTGIRPVMLSMDNYYVDRALTPKKPDGSYDFECIEALDLNLFNSQLKSLLAGQRVETPIFDFVTGLRRSDKSIPLQLGSDQMLIVEGIHGLNPRLTISVPNEAKFRIYVSALTQLKIDEHNRIFTSDMRLMRRIVRDRLFRGYLASDTIRQWPSVREGENEHIFPFQEEADVMFDTSLVYEPAVLRPFLSRFLMEVPANSPSYVEAYRLFNFLNLFIPVLPHEVPNNSILREFIGGSTFSY